MSDRLMAVRDGDGPSNNRMKLTITLAPPPRSTSGGGYACSPFGEHRTLAAYPGCSTDTVLHAEVARRL